MTITHYATNGAEAGVTTVVSVIGRDKDGNKLIAVGGDAHSAPHAGSSSTPPTCLPPAAPGTHPEPGGVRIRGGENISLLPGRSDLPPRGGGAPAGRETR